MKKKIIGILFLLIILLLPSFSLADNGEVFVVPIKGDINRATYNFLYHTMDKITKENPKVIIFEIDTYGGAIVEAEKIKNLIIRSPVPTIAYVNKKAESAGVLITIAAEKVVVANTATIGSAETIP